MDTNKLANTVLYLLRGCGTSRPSLRSLLKMIWFADYQHYRKHLRPITGGRYVALERGPVLDNYVTLFRSFEQQGVIKKTTIEVHGGKSKKLKPKVEYIPKQEPDDAAFLPSERDVLDEIIGRCSGQTSTALSELSHRDAPWIFAWDANNPGRLIPYPLMRWMDNLPEESDLIEAKKAISRPHVAAEIKKLNRTARGTMVAAATAAG